MDEWVDDWMDEWMDAGYSFCKVVEHLLISSQILPQTVCGCPPHAQVQLGQSVRVHGRDLYEDWQTVGWCNDERMLWADLVQLFRCSCIRLQQPFYYRYLQNVLIEFISHGFR